MTTMNEIIELTSLNYARAAILQSRLESEGISCFLSNVNQLRGDISEGVRVMIHRNDLSHALKILDEVRRTASEPEVVERVSRIRRILVPVDFSTYSERAAHFALGLARELKGDVNLIHAYYSPAVGSGIINEAFAYPTGMDTYLQDIVTRARKDLNELGNTLRARVQNEGIRDVRITTSLGHGLPEDVILEYTRKLHPGVVVMGSRGTGGMLYRLFGSVSTRVIENSPVPVIAIPEISGIDDPSHIQNVLYLTRFDESDYVAIERLMNFLAPFRLRFYCLHVETTEDPVVEEVQMNRLRDHFRERYNKMDVHCEVIREDQILRGIERYKLEHDIGLIALTTRKRGFFEKLLDQGTTQQLLANVKAPLLIFKV